MTKLMAVDPGGTSGWATCDLDEPVKTLRWGEATPSEMAKILRGFTSSMDGVIGATVEALPILIMERFTINAFTSKKTAQPDALELIGLGRYLAEWHHCAFELQSPGDAKAFAKDEALRKWGVWVPKLDHARDAVRHLCLALAKRKIFLFE